MKTTLEGLENRLAPLSGASVCLIGLAGMSGWILHAPALLRIVDGYPALHVNTAIGLALAGIGVVLVERRARIAAFCGILLLALGAATLAEYGLKIDLGIDSLIHRPWLAAEVPGRMALNTAVCFVLAGAALTCAGFFPRISGKVALFGGYGLLIVAGSALTGYGLHLQLAYGWASQMKMAIPTALAFALLGAGLFITGWRRVVVNRTLWLTLLVAGLVAGTSTITWLAVETDYRNMGAPQAVPDLMLFTGITRAFIAGIFIFLWRSSSARLDRAEVLNTDLRDKVTERTAQLHAIFDHVQVGTWSYDLVSDKASFQGRAHEIFGFPPGPSEHSLDDFVHAIHPDDREKLREASRRAVEQGGTADLEFRAVWPDRSVHWILARCGVSKYAGGKPVCLSGISLDITRMKNVEAALQSSEASVRKLNEELERRIRIQSKELIESERRFRLMVEGLRDYAFLLLDTEGRVVSSNLGAERIFGYTAEDLSGKHSSILWPEEEIQRSHPEEALQLAAEEGRFEESGWQMTREGRPFWAHVLVTAIHDDTGDLCGFSILTRDITERKRHQEFVEEQRRRAEEANQAKSSFLASMSHEIRTPMNAILGMADLLWDTELDEDQRHYVEIFRRAGASLMDLINDILDLSKIESGRLELEKAEFDVRATVADVIELLAPRAQDKGIGLRSRLVPELTGRVIGDAGRLRQVLVNLVGNSIKFTSSGEVVLSLENRRGDSPEELTFLISDTGIGIPKDKQKAIFEAFQQVDASTARKYGGTGLGLPICQRLVEAMGGVLRVESEPGHGSTFYFTAKFGRAASAEAQPDSARAAGEPVARIPEQARGTLRILIAEDSPDNQFLLEAYLKGTPYVLSFAADGQLAVQKFREGSFDAILMDMEMPVMNGLGATRAIRELEKQLGHRPIPILALTANAHQEAIQECEEAGCTGHLAKPVSKTSLLRALDNLLAASAGNHAAPQNTTVSGRAGSARSAIPPAVVPEGLEALAPKYLSARRKELPEMVALLAASDFEKISSRAHNMKGTGRSYGFPDLTEIGAALERSAKHQDKDAVDMQLMRLSNYLESVQIAGEPAEEPAA